MNTEFQNLPNVVSPKEVQTYFGISRSTGDWYNRCERD